MKLAFIISIILLTNLIVSNYIKLKKEEYGVLSLVQIIIVLIFTLKNKDIIYYPLICFLTLIVVIDYKEMWIPDLSVLMIGLVNMLVMIVDNKFYHRKMEFSGLIYIFFFCLLMIILSFILKKELIGLGDLKLLLAMSIGKSIYKCIILLLVSSLIPFIIFLILKQKKGVEIPFGPFIVLGYLII